MVTWLQNHKEPKSQVVDFMAKTCKARARTIAENKEKTAKEILAMYPRLVDVDGMVSFLEKANVLKLLYIFKELERKYFSPYT